MSSFLCLGKMLREMRDTSYGRGVTELLTWLISYVAIALEVCFEFGLKLRFTASCEYTRRSLFPAISVVIQRAGFRNINIHKLQILFIQCNVLFRNLYKYCMKHCTVTLLCLKAFYSVCETLGNYARNEKPEDFFHSVRITHLIEL